MAPKLASPKNLLLLTACDSAVAMPPSMNKDGTARPGKLFRVRLFRPGWGDGLGCEKCSLEEASKLQHENGDVSCVARAILCWRRNEDAFKG